MNVILKVSLIESIIQRLRQMHTKCNMIVDASLFSYSPLGYVSFFIIAKKKIPVKLFYNPLSNSFAPAASSATPSSCCQAKPAFAKPNKPK